MQRHQFKGDVQPGATPQIAVELQLPAHHFAQRAADHQSQPGTLTARLRVVPGLLERAEQSPLVKGADADAAVLDTHTDREAFRRHRLDRQFQADLPLVGELDGIAQQIGQHLLEASGVDQYVAVTVRIHFNPPLQIFLPGQAFKNPAHRLH
ncbi:hypothetical protein D3C87_1225760 [compost metagenome]